MLFKITVRSGIRTHAQRTGLRPERSALDRSAILTVPYRKKEFIKIITVYTLLFMRDVDCKFT